MALVDNSLLSAYQGILDRGTRSVDRLAQTAAGAGSDIGGALIDRFGDVKKLRQEKEARNKELMEQSQRANAELEAIGQTKASGPYEQAQMDARAEQLRNELQDIGTAQSRIADIGSTRFRDVYKDRAMMPGKVERRGGELLTGRAKDIAEGIARKRAEEKARADREQWLEGQDRSDARAQMRLQQQAAMAEIERDIEQEEAAKPKDIERQDIKDLRSYRNDLIDMEEVIGKLSKIDDLEEVLGVGPQKLALIARATGLGQDSRYIKRAQAAGGAIESLAAAIRKVLSGASLTDTEKQSADIHAPSPNDSLETLLEKAQRIQETVAAKQSATLEELRERNVDLTGFGGVSYGSWWDGAGLKAKRAELERSKKGNNVAPKFDPSKPFEKAE